MAIDGSTARGGAPRVWPHGVRAGWLLVVSGVIAAPDAARAGVWDELPLAALMRPDLERLSEAALRARADTLRQRLFIDEQAIAIERGEDLELVIGYAAAVELLWERDRSPEVAGARRSAAYLMHATGWLAQERGDLRVAIAELGAREEPAARALATSVKALRGVGREAFAAALVAAPSGAATAAQAGRVALREGAALEAARRFMAAAEVEPLPRFAVDACEALLTLDDEAAAALCARLEARFVATWPASAGRFAQVRQRAEDALRSKEFVARGREGIGDLAELAAEIGRARRLGREGAARRLAKVTTGRFPGDVRSWRLAAEVAVAAGSAADLREVVREAARHGYGDDARLAEAQAALEIGQAIARALDVDGLGERRSGRREADVDASTRRWVERLGGPTGRQLRALLALVEADGEQGARAERALSELLAGEADAVSALLALVIALAHGRWEDDAARIVDWSQPTGAEVAELAARIELGLAIGARDPDRVARAIGALTAERPEAALARVVGRRTLEVMTGAALAKEGLEADRQALARLAFAFDEASDAGRALAQARALSLATLEVRAGRPLDAAELLREARRFGGDLGVVAGGLAQLLAGDGHGALELCGRGAGVSGPIGQALLSCQAVGAPEAEAPRLWGLALAAWDGANLPHRLEAGTARPLQQLRLDVAVRLEPGAPLSLQVEIVPTAMLIPELSPSRAEVARRAHR